MLDSAIGQKTSRNDDTPKMNTSNVGVLFYLFAGLSFSLGSIGTCSAQESNSSARFHKSILSMRDEVFSNAILKLKIDGSLTSNGKVVAKESGTIVFARCGSSILVDTSISTELEATADGHKYPSDLMNSQHVISRDSKCINVNYKLVKGKPVIIGLSHDPRNSYEDNFHILAKESHLDLLLSRFHPTSKSLDVIVKSESEITRQTTGGGIKASYRTPYGTIDVTINKSGIKDTLSRVGLVQSANDVYSHLSNGQALKDLKERTVLGKTPGGGLARTSRTVTLSYGAISDTKPFNSINIEETIEADGNKWQAMRQLRLLEYVKCSQPGDLNRLRIPIPDGEAVILTDDPESNTLLLAYQNGEIVRQVDGAALQDVLIERRAFNSRFLVYGLLAATTIALLAIWLIRNRRFVGKLRGSTNP